MRFLTITCLILFPVALLAQPAATPTMDDAPGLLGVTIESFRDGNWPLAIGSLALLLFLIVGAVNGFLAKMTSIPDATRKTILEWSVAAGGMLSAFGLALIGGADWLTSILAGFITGTAASGFWQLIVKKIVKALTKNG